MDPTIAYEKLMRAAMLSAGAQAVEHAAGACTVRGLSIAGGGALPPLVLMHGFSASGPSQWASVCRRIRGEVRQLWVPDLPGHGASRCDAPLTPEVMMEATAEALFSWLEEPAILVASSLSGGIALRFANRHPERVAGLMLCSPGGAPLTEDEADKLLDLFDVDRFPKALAFVDRVFGKAPLMRPLVAWGVMRQLRRPRFVKLLAHVREHPALAPAELAAIRVPVHLLWGAADGVLPESSFAFYRDHLPAGTAIERPNYGHAPFLEAPAALSASVLAFARRVAASPSTTEPAPREARPLRTMTV